MANYLVKRLHASESVLNLMIWATLSLLSTRLLLQLTGYFILGRGPWHIAHVLWGGLFMLLGSLIMLIFYGQLSRKIGAILTGIGWGLFIDEIGKYVTQDNNYWFRPAIIFIYISFILLFLLYRNLEKKTQVTSQILWPELLESLGEIANNDLEFTEKKSLLQKINYLQKNSPPQDQSLLLSLKTYVQKIQAKPDRRDFNLYRFLARILKTSYNKLFRKKIMLFALTTYSIWYVIDKFIDAAKVLFNPHRLLMIQTYYSHYDFFSKADVYMVTFKFIIEIIVAVFYCLGLLNWLNKKTFRGIKFYQWGLLINIFIGSIFKFYFEQFSGVFGLILSLIIYYSLRRFSSEIRK
ncbi:MAG: hypothetical protein WC784_01285 [Candidatus Shapirobacteria bacterium]|jgi:hypothetical protein